MPHASRGERLALTRAYVKDHRRVWKEQGFSSLTLMAPNADKTEITAFVDIVRFERLLSKVASGDLPTIEFVSSRNMNQLPDAADMSQLSKDSEQLEAELGRRVRALINLALSYSSAHRQQMNRIEIARNAAERNLYTALAVLYSNLANANSRLAIALTDGEPRIANVVAIDKLTGKLVTQE